MDKGDYPRTCLPQIGSKAPPFTASTTMGPVSLSDYAGQWVVLFSHPGDFTPVLETQIIVYFIPFTLKIIPFTQYLL